MAVNWKQLFLITWTFCRIAPSTFGGGFSMIPVLEREAVHKRRWIDQNEIADVLAVSQTIPGAVGLNAASYIGFRVAGIPGAVAALIGMLMPTFLIVIGLAALMVAYRDQSKVNAALQGMKPAIVALIVYAGIRTAKNSLKDIVSITIAFAALVVLVGTSVSPIWVIVGGAVVGIGIRVLDRRKHPITNRPVRPYTEPDYYFGEGI
jgi:chromate transporter